MIRILLLLMASLAAVATAAEPPLRGYSAEYSVELNGIKVGELQRRLQQLENGQYLLETRAYTTGVAAWFKPDIATETTLWQFADGQPRPLRYTYHYTGRSKERYEQQDFDWDSGQLSYVRGDKSARLELSPGVLDKQVFEIAMQRAIASGVQEHTFAVASRDKLTEYEFRVLGSEEITTGPLGRVKTLKVERGDSIIWLATEHDYLAVKIRHTERGGTATSHLTAIRY